MHADSDQTQRLALKFADGLELKVERNGDKLKLWRQNAEWGTLKLGPDRIKLIQGGKETAKAKAKDYGFKVYDGETEVFKVKRRGAGYEVRRANESKLGEVQADTGQFGSEGITIESRAGTQVLKRGGKKLLSLSGSMRPTALLMLAVTEATLAQRLVMAGIVNEGIAP